MSGEDGHAPRQLFEDDPEEAVYDEEDDDALLGGADEYETRPETQKRVRLMEVDATVSTARSSEDRAEKSNKNKKTKKNKKGEREPKEQSEFDRIMETAKQKRKKRQFTEEEASTRVQNFLLKMRDAADQDDNNMANGMPAVAKLGILDEVCTEIVKPAWTLWYLQEGLLGVLERWLTPLPDGGLPNLTLRTKVLTTLTKIHCSPDYMANTSLGERLLELWKSPEESEENRQNIRKIVSALIKPILGLRYSSQQQSEALAEKVAAPAAQTHTQAHTRSQFRAAPPRVQARQFRVAPKSQIQAADLGDRRGEDEQRMQKLDSKFRQPKRKPARTGGSGYA